MKIVKEKSEVMLVALTIRIPAKLLKELTELADKNDLSRQKLITAIFDKALSDKNFQIRIKE